MSDTTPRYFSGYTPISDEQIEREMREATEAGEIPVPVRPDPWRRRSCARSATPPTAHG